MRKGSVGALRPMSIQLGGGVVARLNFGPLLRVEDASPGQVGIDLDDLHLANELIPTVDGELEARLDFLVLPGGEDDELLLRVYGVDKRIDRGSNQGRNAGDKAWI